MHLVNQAFNLAIVEISNLNLVLGSDIELQGQGQTMTARYSDSEQSFRYSISIQVTLPSKDHQVSHACNIRSEDDLRPSDGTSSKRS